MIQTRLWARLGNQCFMLAACIAHAKKMGTTFAAPRATIDPRIWPIYFRGLPIASHATRNYYKEPRHAYDPLPEHDDMTIEGYFQSEKYFADAKPEVAKSLGFVRKKTDYVAVHIRRGDYLLYPDQFPVLPLEYYFKSIDYIVNNSDHAIIFKIYSDDIPWCKGAFGDHTFVYSSIKDPLTDMRDMFNAAGFIISNSSYSLFPALLRDDAPMVVAPAENRWYGPANAKLETSDLMPERFIKI